MVGISSKKEGCDMGEPKENKSKKIKKEITSKKSELNKLQDEIDSLNMDLKTKNEIIQDLTGQLTEKQTELMKAVKIVDALQTSLEQNRKEMGEKNKDLHSVKTELLSKKEECNMLYENLESRNMIIEDLTGQLTEKQTEILETFGDANKFETNLKQKEIQEKNMDFDLIAVNLPSIGSEFENKENIRSELPISLEKKEREGRITEQIQLIKQRFRDIQSETIRLQNDLEKTLENIEFDINNIESHDTVNEELNKELRANKAALSWFNNELEAKEEALRLKENEICTLRGELENKIQVNLEKKQQEIETLNEALKTRNKIIESINNQLAERQTVILNKTKTAERLQKDLDLSNQELIQRINTISQLQKELNQTRESRESIASELCSEDDALANLHPEQKNQMKSELEQETVIEQNQTWKNNVAVHDNIDKTLEIEEDNLKTKKWKNEESE